MHRFIVLSAVLAGLALPAGARPIEPDGILPTQQLGRDDNSRNQGGAAEGRSVLLPRPVAARFDVIAPPVPEARSGEPRPVRRFLEMPWQSGVFQ
jgi:hypothetical protein